VCVCVCVRLLCVHTHNAANLRDLHNDELNVRV